MVSQRILEPPAEYAVFLVLTVRPGDEATVTDFLGEIDGYIRTVGFRYPEALLTCVVGIGSAFYDRAYVGPKPAGLHPFRELVGPRHTAPSTPGDLLLHLRARRKDMCWELADLLMRKLGESVRIVDETQGFKFFDERDLLGFVDGTENPEGEDAANAVLVGDEDPDFAGSSYVIVQKYLHDMDAWRSITVAEQERVIGRTKLENVEFDDDAKAPDAHIVLNVIEDDDGNQLQIVRDNMPFGSFDPPEQGTFFIGYAADPAVTEKMLTNMFIGNPPGVTDRILDFSTAKTGSLFFVPTQDFLSDQPLKVPAEAAGSGDADAHDGASDPTDQSPTDDSDEPRSDGSLGIGSLKRRTSHG